MPPASATGELAKHCTTQASAARGFPGISPLPSGQGYGGSFGDAE